jgi:hypothetical protein
VLQNKEEREKKIREKSKLKGQLNAQGAKW